MFAYTVTRQNKMVFVWLSQRVNYANTLATCSTPVQTGTSTFSGGVREMPSPIYWAANLNEQICSESCSTCSYFWYVMGSYYFGHIKAATVYLFRYVMAPTLFWYVMTYHNVVVCQGCHIYLACRSLSVSFCKELKTSLISFFTSLDNSLLVCNQLSQ